MGITRLVVAVAVTTFMAATPVHAQGGAGGGAGGGGSTSKGGQAHKAGASASPAATAKSKTKGDSMPGNNSAGALFSGGH